MKTTINALVNTRNHVKTFQRIISSPSAIVTLLLVFVWCFGCVFVPQMLMPNNLINVVRSGAITGMFAIAATVVLLVGEIDLSLGSTMVLALIIGSQLNGITSDIWMIVVTLLAGALLGFINGAIVSVFKVKSLMVTLGTLSLYGGIAYLISGGRTVLFYRATNYLWMGTGMVGNIPVPVIFFLITVAILFIMLQFTKFGRSLYFTGANPLSAWLSGVNSRKLKLIAFVISGFCAAAGGLFQAALLNEVAPTYGVGYEMTGLSIAVFGGTSMVVGGKGSILSTAVAVMAFQLLLNVLTLSGLGTYMEQLFKGIFLIVIVIVFQYMEQWRSARL